MRSLLSCFFCLLIFNCTAQNWKTVPLNDTVYFSSANHYLRILWIDSVFSNNNDSSFTFYKAIRDTNFYDCIDTLADTWLGASFIRKTNSDEYYFNSFHDTIFIHTSA